MNYGTFGVSNNILRVQGYQLNQFNPSNSWYNQMPQGGLESKMYDLSNKSYQGSRRVPYYNFRR
jgi:hypothetical protein